jgi:hypothetical protein
MEIYMRYFTSKSIYDEDTEEWLETYYIDGKLVSEEEYFEEMENEEYGVNYEDDDSEYELSDGEIEEIRLISEYRDKILESDGCPDCTLRFLVDFANIFRNIGFEDAKVLMGSFLNKLD